MQREENHSVLGLEDGQVKEARQQGEDGSANRMVGSLASDSHNHKHNYKRISIFRWSKN